MDDPRHLKFASWENITALEVEYFAIQKAISEVPRDVPLDVVCHTRQCYVAMSINVPLWSAYGWVHGDGTAMLGSDILQTVDDLLLERAVPWYGRRQALIRLRNSTQK